MTKFSTPNGTLTTRTCQLRDYHFVFTLTKDVFWPYMEAAEPDKKTFDKKFFKSYKELEILLLAGEKVGLLWVEDLGNKYHIHRLAIVSGAKEKGIEEAVFAHYFAEKPVEIELWHDNPAIKFYKKLGFKEQRKKENKLVLIHTESQTHE